MSKMKHEEGKPKKIVIKDCINGDIKMELIKESGMEDKHVGITISDEKRRICMLINKKICERIMKYLKSIIGDKKI